MHRPRHRSSPQDRLTRVAALLALCACVLASPLPATGLAICFGSDGHVAVGPADDSCACDHDEHAAAYTSVDPRLEPAHPPCIDLHLEAVVTGGDVRCGSLHEPGPDVAFVHQPLDRHLGIAAPPRARGTAAPPPDAPPTSPRRLFAVLLI